jgi:porphobilinogen synthase
MSFPITRMRRLRRTPQIRAMVRETRVTPNNLMLPFFLVPGTGVKKEISSLPGLFHLSTEKCVEEAKRIADLGIPSVLLFAIPEYKDATGSSASKDNGVVQRTVTAIKESVPNLTVCTDLCFCEYTSHGHCGIIHNNDVDNDATLKIIAEQTLSHARAGADIIAPSGMMDGVVQTMRSALDEKGFTDTIIMSYAAKFSSAFYGPFREAVQSAPEFGDRRTYQMDPANSNEALREVKMDIAEGADIVMVKPALAYLDIIQAVKEQFHVPTAAYNVSGEYAMVKAAAAKGWVDGRRIMLETLLSIKRAGADIIITYFAEEFAQLYKQGAVE